MPKERTLPTDFTSLERQGRAALLEPLVELKLHPEVSIFKEQIPIEASTTIECVREEPPGKPRRTIFYIPGTASVAHFPAITNAEGSHLAFRSESRVIIIYHRLSGQNKYPIPLNDICRVIEYYINHSDIYDIDANKIAIGGYSAGALLAIQICLACAEKGITFFRHLILVAPVTSLSDRARPYGNGTPLKNQEDFYLTHEFFQAMVKDYVPKEMDPNSILFSPAYNKESAFNKFPPVTIIHGEFECFNEDTESFIQLLHQHEINAEKFMVNKGTHSFPWKSGEHITPPVIERIDRFFNEAKGDADKELPYFSLPQLSVYGDTPPYNDAFHVPRKKCNSSIMNYFYGVSSKGENRKVFILSGGAGYGKTQLALDYFYQSYKKYSYRWWFSATDFTHPHEYEQERDKFPYIYLNAQYRRIALENKWVDSEAKASICINKVKEWLENCADWLLVFDDATSFEVLEQYLPRFGGHILITTRQPQMGKDVLKIDSLEYEEAVVLTDNILGMSDESEERKELINHFGLHPLALIQVCAYIKEKNLSISEFFECYQKEKEKETILYANSFLIRNPQHDSFFISWSIILKQLFSISQDAFYIVLVSSFLAPDNIPSIILEYSLLDVEIEKLKQDEKEIRDRYINAINILNKQYSIISIKRNTEGMVTHISIHPLVQDVLQSFLSNDDVLISINKLLKSLYYISTILKIKLHGRDVIHLNNLLEHAEKNANKIINHSYLSYAFVLLSFLQSDALCVSSSLETTYKAENYLDNDNVEPSLKIRIKDAKRNAYWLMGDIKNCLEVSQEIFGFFDNKYKESNEKSDLEESAKAAHNLATSYHRIGWLEKAEEKLKYAISIFKEASKTDESFVTKLAKSSIILAYVYIDKNQLNQAFDCVESISHLIHEKSAEYVWTLFQNCKGNILAKKGENKLARWHLTAALNLLKREYDGYHRLIAQNEVFLATILESEEEMVEGLKRGFNMLFSIYKEDNLYVATAYLDAGIALFNRTPNLSKLILCQSYRILQKNMQEEYFRNHFKVKKILDYISLDEISEFEEREEIEQSIREKLLLVFESLIEKPDFLENTPLKQVRHEKEEENLQKKQLKDANNTIFTHIFSSSGRNCLFFTAGVAAGVMSTLLVQHCFDPANEMKF